MNLIYYPDENLSIPCKQVQSFDLELNLILDEMKKIMLNNQGMGLAHNQINGNKRIFIMKDNKNKIWEFINPVIISTDGVQFLKEGCLSFPGVNIEIPRAEQITVKAYNRNGEEFKVGCIGIEAVCIQHEIDHLNGKSFIDNLSRQEKRRITRIIKKYV